MVKLSSLQLVVMSVYVCHVLYVGAQYTPKPSGVTGVVHSIVTTATDTVGNAFETADEAIDALERLLKNALYTMINNPFTRLTAGYRNRAVGSSLIMLRGVYQEALEMVIELLDQRKQRLNEVRDQIKRTTTLLEGPINEIKEKARCMTTLTATEITNDLLKCAVEVVHNTLTEVTLTQQDVSKIFEKLKIQLDMRSFCLRKQPRDAVVCIQDMITDTPNFLEMVQTSFSSRPSMFDQMETINVCASEMKQMAKNICPAYEYY